MRSGCEMSVECPAPSIRIDSTPRRSGTARRAHSGDTRWSTVDRTSVTATSGHAATGVTSGDLLRGVRYRGSGAYTQSIVMRSKSGTIRVIDSYHRLEKLRHYSLIDFDGAP